MGLNDCFPGLSQIDAGRSRLRKACAGVDKIDAVQVELVVETFSDDIEVLEELAQKLEQSKEAGPMEEGLKAWDQVVTDATEHVERKTVVGDSRNHDHDQARANEDAKTMLAN